MGPYEHDRCPIRLVLKFPHCLPPLLAWLKEVKVIHRKSDVGELNVTVTFVTTVERGSALARTTSWRSERKPHTVIGNGHVTSRHRNSAQGYKKVFSPHSFLPSLHLHLCYSRLEPINPLQQHILDILCFWSSLLLLIGRTPCASVPTYPSFLVPIRPRPECIRLRLGVIRARV